MLVGQRHVLPRAAWRADRFILRPRDPNLPELHFIEEIFRLEEPGDVVPMLMGKNKNINFLIRRLHHVLDYFCHYRLGVCRGDSNAAIDQDLIIGAIVFPKADEDAIA